VVVAVDTTSLFAALNVLAGVVIGLTEALEVIEKSGI
jgi:hypothetical protein